MLKFSMASASGCGKCGRKPRTNVLKFSFNIRCDSVAIVSNTMEDLPEPETPVKMVILTLWGHATRHSLSCSRVRPEYLCIPVPCIFHVLNILNSNYRTKILQGHSLYHFIQTNLTTASSAFLSQHSVLLRNTALDTFKTLNKGLSWV
jgi:hypothetical protein